MSTLRMTLIMIGFSIFLTGCDDILGPADLGLGGLDGVECLIAWEDPACSFLADSVAVDTVANDSTDP